jgi:hypothetical protein
MAIFFGYKHKNKCHILSIEVKRRTIDVSLHNYPKPTPPVRPYIQKPQPPKCANYRPEANKQ